MDNYYEFRKKLGLKLKQIRESKGYTQQKVAFDIGVDISFIGRIEKAERVPSFETILKLAEVFELKPSNLMAKVEKELPEGFNMLDTHIS